MLSNNYKGGGYSLFEGTICHLPAKTDENRKISVAQKSLSPSQTLKHNHYRVKECRQGSIKHQHPVIFMNVTWLICVDVENVPF
jgi:predicted nucleic acid binding AN1-type Zn finger protein